MMKRTNESGRSMVEMLGVLAIIGVLSIGGIAGYSMAMNRYRANEALDLATKYAVVLYSGKQTYAALGHNMNDYKPLSLYAVGLTNDKSTGSNSKNKTKTPGGAYIYTPTKDKIDENNSGGVEIKIDFGSEAVCKAALSILGESIETGKCSAGSSGTSTNTELSHVFKQS